MPSSIDVFDPDIYVKGVPHDAFRVLRAESPVSFECRVTQIVQLQGIDGTPVPTWLTLGEVVAVHIDKAFLKDGIYDTAAARPILRAGGPADYFEIGAEQLFRMWRPR